MAIHFHQQPAVLTTNVTRARQIVTMRPVWTQPVIIWVSSASLSCNQAMASAASSGMRGVDVRSSHDLCHVGQVDASQELYQVFRPHGNDAGDHLGDIHGCHGHMH
jgi:hypothetical protein